MQIITISGNLGKDAELRTAGNDDVCSFSVGVRQGWGDKASSNWFRVNVWGKRGKTLQPMLAKGMKVVVVGELTIGEYNGKPQFDVRASEVDFTPSKDGPRNQGSQTQSRGGHDADLDDDVPF